jgi:hypothetical protein
MLRFASRIAHHASALSSPDKLGCWMKLLDAPRTSHPTGARKQVPEDVKF